MVCPGQDAALDGSRLWQVFAGVGSVISLGLHFIANHFIAKGGLRDFADAVAYLRNHIILILELLFLLCVTSHPERAEKRIGQVLTLVGV